MRYWVGVFFILYSISISAKIIDYRVQDTFCTPSFSSSDVVTIKNIFSKVKYDVIEVLPNKVLGSNDIVINQENSNLYFTFDSNFLEYERYYLVFLKFINNERWVKINYCNRKINDNFNSFNH